MRVLVQSSLPHGLIVPRRLATIALRLLGMLATDSTPTAEALPATRVVPDLAPLQDARRVLINPHKGWYYHYPIKEILGLLLSGSSG
jgi:hypothetical protein